MEVTSDQLRPPPGALRVVSESERAYSKFVCEICIFVAQPRSRDICTSTSHTWLDFRGFSGGIVGDRQTDRFRLGVIQTNGETNSITTVESVISLPAQNQARVGEQPGYSSLSKPVFVMQIASWSC